MGSSGLGITAADFERRMLRHEEKLGKIVFADYMKNQKDDMVSDIVTVLNQFGYSAGAEIFERIFCGDGRSE